MKRILLLLGLLILAGVVLYKLTKDPVDKVTPTQSPVPTVTSVEEVTQVSVIAENLDTPWAIAFLPDKSMLVTERAGRVRMVENGNLQEEPIAVIGGSKEIGEGGLMGIALHPNFPSNNFVYLYYTYESSGDDTLNRVVRMRYKDKKLEDEQTIVDNIPGASNHNGGRIKFGPDNFLYITTGDAQNPSLSQDKNSLAGKILRFKDEKVEVFSYGHRNPQGLAWDNQGRLWETEHGPSGGSLGFGNDEVNIIFQGKNYGWPTIQGDNTQEGMENPFKHSGTSTWAPAGAAVINDTLFFGGLRGAALYSLDIKADPRLVVTERKIKEHFTGQFGRIREVIVGPDNMLYVTTSNKDGRGIPKGRDDKIIKINPQKL